VARDEMRIDRFSPRATRALAQGSDPNGEPAAVPRTAQAARDALTSVVGTLLDLGMPSQEIAVVVAADQPILVHRYLELHGERLTERLADQLQILARLEQTLHRAHLDRSHQTATAGSLCSRDVPRLRRSPPCRSSKASRWAGANLLSTALPRTLSASCTTIL
jgi:hypothetical protein